MTHDELVKKVARAICKENFGTPDDWKWLVGEDDWKWLVGEAEAAIAVVVEECARVAEDCIDDKCEVTKRVIGAAIRKLGETP